MATFGFTWRRTFPETPVIAPPVAPVAVPAAPPAAPPADLGTQLEDIVVAVWREEQMWRVEDRINLAVRLAEHRPAR